MRGVGGGTISDKERAIGYGVKMLDCWEWGRKGWIGIEDTGGKARSSWP